MATGDPGHNPHAFTAHYKVFGMPRRKFKETMRSNQSTHYISHDALKNLLQRQQENILTPAEKVALRKANKLGCTLYKAGPELKSVREYLALSWRDVATEVGLSHTSIKNIENGKPVRLRHAQLLARFFGHKLDSMFKKLT